MINNSRRFIMTIRQLKIAGSVNVLGSTGTISYNGTQVLNGPFVGDTRPDSGIFSGSIDVDDGLAVNQEILVPTVITVTTGRIFVALTEWNYAIIFNPVFTTEQLDVLRNLTTTNEERLAIVEPLASPPLSAAEKTFLLSTDPVDNAEQIRMLSAHNVYYFVQDPATFDWGVSQEEDTCNRVNVLLDGVEPAGANTNAGLVVEAGQTLTYDSIVFASNIYSNYY